MKYPKHQCGTDQVNGLRLIKLLSIQQFRYCSFNNAFDYSVPELLKTVEMSEITVMTSLFKCENARDNIDALLNEYDVVLLNKMTSYKYVK